MGVLGWTPTEFWAATPHDFHAALDGWSEARGQRSAEALTAEDVQRLRERLDAELRKEIAGGR